MHYESKTPSHTTVYVSCDCGSEVISIEWDRGENMVWFSLLESRPQHGQRSWHRRIRHIWRIIRKGDPWGDWAVLNQDQARLLANTMNLFVIGSTAEPREPEEWLAAGGRTFTSTEDVPRPDDDGKP